MSEVVVLSLGAGVQSTTLLLMACAGEVEPRPVEAVFADTQDEPKAVYRHLEWLEAVSSIPIIRVTKGRLSDTLADDNAFVPLPFYVRDATNTLSMLRRQCTNQYKIQPIRRHLRATYPKQRIRLLHGISLDEAVRMRDSDVQYIENVYPLVEKRMTRHDCLLWLERNGYPRPPKSACYYCPFMDNARWATMKRETPDEFASAVAFDESIRTLPRVSGTAYIHRSGVPLADVDLSTPEDKGQLGLFDDECEGMCGV